MKTDKQIESDHKYHTERINGQTIIKDDTLADQKKQRKEKSIDRIKSVASNTSGLFGSIIIILVGVAMVRLLYYGSTDGITIGSLLDLFANVPQVSTSVKNFVQQLQISGPWPVLDGIRNFINLNLSAVSIVVWLASSLLDVCMFLAYFLQWLFI